MKKEHRLSVLFLCTGNSCRSQIAEAIVNHKFAARWVAYSAGTFPPGYVHPNALAVLQEVGITHHGESKDLSAIKHIDFDLVVTVCDSAAENCPICLGKGYKVHLGFPDPAEVKGSQEESMAVFRQVRDAIGRDLLKLLTDTQSELATGKR